jgi:cold shock protein
VAKASGGLRVRSEGPVGRDANCAQAAEQCGGGFPMAMTGTVKFFNGERGYGFIKPDDGGRDVFVHITAVERAGLKDLTEGQRITFEVEPDKKGKGPKAVNLVISS